MGISTLCYSGCQTLRLFPQPSEFPSPGATVPSVTLIPGTQEFQWVCLWVAQWPCMGLLWSEQWHDSVTWCYFCLNVSGFHFRLTHNPKTRGCMASHVLIRAVICSDFLLIKIWFSGLQELLLELGISAKGQASPTPGIVRLQLCWGEFMGLPLKLAAWVKFSLLSLSFLSKTDWLCFPCSWLSVQDTKIGRVHFHYLRVRQKDV